MDQLSLQARVQQLEEENEVLRKRLFIQGLELSNKDEPPKAPKRQNDINRYVPLKLFKQFMSTLKPDQQNDLLVEYEVLKLDRLQNGVGSKRKTAMHLPKVELFSGFSSNEALVTKQETLQVHRASSERIRKAEQLVSCFTELTQELGVPLNGEFPDQVARIGNLIKDLKEKKKDEQPFDDNVWKKAEYLIRELSEVLDNLEKEESFVHQKGTSLLRTEEVHNLKERLEKVFGTNGQDELQAKVVQLSQDKYGCSKCPEKVYSRKDNAASHIQFKHSNSPKKACPYCDEKISVYNNSFCRHVKNCRKKLRKSHDEDN